MTPWSLRRKPLTLCVLSLSMAMLHCPLLVQAQEINAALVAPRLMYPARLSDIILEERRARQGRHETDIFLPAMIWRSQSELRVQRELKTQILDQVRQYAHEASQRDNYEALFKRLDVMPVTGRVTLLEHDPYWLQVNPKQDPIVQERGDLSFLLASPQTVSVMREDGSLCTVKHQPSVQVAYYVKECAREGTAIDWAWVIQPNGRVQKVGTAIWNQAAHDEPMLGAWIWMPTRQVAYSLKFSEAVAQFLATQGASSEGLAGEAFVLSGQATHSDWVSEAQQVPRDRAFPVTANDWGTIGLLQTPTARMNPAGEISVTYSNVYPYMRTTVMFQPLEALEFGFRYTNVSNRLYGPRDFSGDQRYKDKSIDAKFRVMEESTYLPQLAVGLQDVAGTGFFSGEYLVASKRFGAFDWSLGLGWGYLGAASTVKNPLSVFSSKFNNRVVDTGQGGTFSAKSYFRGTAALIGGVQYQTPWEPLIVKLELDGNNYQHEPLDNIQPRRSPINAGIVYRWKPYLDVAVGIERGNKAALNIHLHENFSRMGMPKLSMPRPIPVVAKPIGSHAESALPVSASEERITVQTIEDIERQADWQINEITSQGSVWTVTVKQSGGYLQERLDRVLAVLHRDAPTDITHFRMRYLRNGVEIAEHRIDRRAWMEEQTRLVPPSEQRLPIELRPETPYQLRGDGETVASTSSKQFEGGLGFIYGQTLGGPSAFWLYQISAEASGRLDLWKGAFINGRMRYRLVDNYNKFTVGGSSNLPRVRTYLREYLTTSNHTMPLLQATQLAKLGDSHFFSAYGGYLENMFGGVGAEYLWRPTGSRLALGVDINQVRQRAFEQNFDWRDYKVKTGHLTAYWDTGWQNVLATVSAGKYLAGDKGVTVDVKKVFQNGVTMGVFATKTNVSAEQFGEGSFNKGIYFTIPFDAVLTRYSNSRASVVWTPLTRDGGAKLGRSVQLYDYTSQRSPTALEFAPPK